MSDTKTPDPLVGTTIAGRYEVLRLVDQGGMGSIYEVAHTSLKRRFAVKTLAPVLASAPEALARFQREANVIASLRHPHIVDVIGWETLPDGQQCMVMELLEGHDLCARLDRVGPMEWADIARIGDEVLSAVAVAHRAGIIHRDLKPQNIFLASYDADDEKAKLLDFGISKIRDSNTLAARSDSLMGTPEYMSPEQAEGHGDEVSAASDVWAMGAILYEMATGRQAFSGDSVPAILRRVCDGQPEPILLHRPDAPADFIQLVGGALSRDPAHRIVDATDLRRGLRAALGLPSLSRELAAARTPPPEPDADPQSDGLAYTSTVSSAVGQATLQEISSARTSTLWPWLGLAAVALGGALFFVVGAGRPDTASPHSNDTDGENNMPSSSEPVTPPTRSARGAALAETAIPTDAGPSGAVDAIGAHETDAIAKSPPARARPAKRRSTKKRRKKKSPSMLDW